MTASSRNVRYALNVFSSRDREKRSFSKIIYVNSFRDQFVQSYHYSRNGR